MVGSSRADRTLTDLQDGYSLHLRTDPLPAVEWTTPIGSRQVSPSAAPQGCPSTGPDCCSFPAELSPLPTPLDRQTASAALIGVTRHLPGEPGPYAITVYALVQGRIATPPVRKVSDAANNTMIGVTPLRRLGETSEVAGGWLKP